MPTVPPAVPRYIPHHRKSAQSLCASIHPVQKLFVFLCVKKREPPAPHYTARPRKRRRTPWLVASHRERRVNEMAVYRLFDSGQFEIQLGNRLACAYDLAANGDLAASGPRFGAVSFPIAG